MTIGILAELTRSLPQVVMEEGAQVTTIVCKIIFYLYVAQGNICIYNVYSFNSCCCSDTSCFSKLLSHVIIM